MQAGSITVPVQPMALASTTPAADAAGWQDALTQEEGQTAPAPATPPPTAPAEVTATPTPATPPQAAAIPAHPPARPGDNSTVPAEAAGTAAQTAATAKTPLQHGKKPASLAAGTPPLAPQQHKTSLTPTPVAFAACLPVTAPPAIAVPSGTGRSRAVAGAAQWTVQVAPHEPAEVPVNGPVHGALTAQAGANTPPATPASPGDVTSAAWLGQAATAKPEHGGVQSVLMPPQASPLSATTLSAVPLSAAIAPAAAPMPANLAATVQAAPTGHAGKATLPPDAVAGLSATGSSKASLEAASAGAAAAASLAPPAKTLDTPDQSSQSVPQAAFTMPGTMPGTTAPAPAPGVAATAAPLIQPNAAGLAATVTAMHQAGQSGAVLRLDPPGLGNLSVHVALGQNGQVNVLFIPSTQAASTVLQNNLAGLGTALAQSGITLGQAQVGGQFNQNAGQGTYQPPSPPSFTQQAFAQQGFAQPAASLDAAAPAPSGVSAYA